MTAKKVLWYVSGENINNFLREGGMRAGLAKMMFVFCFSHIEMERYASDTL